MPLSQGGTDTEEPDELRAYLAAVLRAVQEIPAPDPAMVAASRAFGPESAAVAGGTGQGLGVNHNQAQHG